MTIFLLEDVIDVRDPSGGEGAASSAAEEDGDQMSGAIPLVNEHAVKAAAHGEPDPDAVNSESPNAV